MPTYVYACKECGHGMEVVQSFTDETLTICPECQGALRKKFNSVGVVFKGSGFYRNDSRSTTSSSTPATDGSKAATPASTPAAAPASAPASASTSA